MFQVLANPAKFMAFSKWLTPIIGVIAVGLLGAGLWLGFHVPDDYQQGRTVRLLFIHPQLAILSMFAYACLGGAAFFGVVFRHALADAAARAAAPLGAAYTFLALLTGSFWGRPMWGTWWVWDARLTSELILLFLYLGYLGLVSAIDDPRRADRGGAILLLAGSVNVPIIYFSVQWWNTLHQGASVSFTAAPAMAHTMLVGMLLMVGACWAYSIAVALTRVRCLIVERDILARRR